MAVRQELTFDDPAVETALNKQDSGRNNAYDRITKVRNLTPSQRKKMERDAARTTATIDLPPTLLADLRALAKREGVALSGLASLLLQVGLRDLNSGTTFDLQRYKIITRSVRFEWDLAESLDDVEDDEK